jgi:hypothetical protein
MRPADLTGYRYGRLTVLHRAKTPSKNLRWVCLCDCGNTTEVRGDALKAKRPVTSCGCYGLEQQLLATVTHGMTGTPTYRSWYCMKQRCLYSRDKKFHAYGARGITICKRWRHFENFLIDMGIRPKGTTLDRINGHLGYFPENCRWAGIYTQRHNRIPKLQTV